MAEWLTIYKDKNQIRAEQLKNELASSGINVVLLNLVDKSYPVFGLVELKVVAEQKEIAEEIIKEFLLNDKETK
jgi:Putative prokaryotic signal transducing protein